MLIQALNRIGGCVCELTADACSAFLGVATAHHPGAFFSARMADKTPRKK